MKGLIRLVDSHLNSQLKGSQHYENEKRRRARHHFGARRKRLVGLRAYTASKAAVSPE